MFFLLFFLSIYSISFLNSLVRTWRQYVYAYLTGKTLTIYIYISFFIAWSRRSKCLCTVYRCYCQSCQRPLVGLMRSIGWSLACVVCTLTCTYWPLMIQCTIDCPLLPLSAPMQTFDFFGCRLMLGCPLAGNNFYSFMFLHTCARKQASFEKTLHPPAYAKFKLHQIEK